MRLEPTSVDGCWLIRHEPSADERGSFARIFSSVEFEQQGLAAQVSQCSLSRNRRRLTLRGLHYQAAPHQEMKLVTCVQGLIYDVVVDLRRSSSTYRQWYAQELSPDRDCSLAVPEGCAHGFLTLVDETTVHYQISTPHVAAAARGVRWDDPGIAIAWPAAPVVIADRDASFLDHRW